VKRYTPDELRTAFAKGHTANAMGGQSPRSPQRAPSVQAVRDILQRINLGWDGSLNSGLREIWLRILHGIKGSLPDDEDEAREIAEEWSGPEEPDFQRVWESIKPTTAGWGVLEIEAKARAGADMAADAFGDDAGVLGATIASGHPLTPEQLTVARWIKDEYGPELKYNHDRRRWVEFRGGRWKLWPAKHKRVFELSRAWAGMITDRKSAGSASFHDGVENMLRNDSGLLAAEIDFDQDPWLAGVPGGTLELRTGKVRAGKPSDMISKSLACDPAVREDCPRWLKFVGEITRGDVGMAWFLQQWAGYCLTGDASEEKLLFMYGPGGNGKSKYADTLREMLGDYGVQASRDVFVKKAHAGHGTEIAKMVGSRLVTMSEVSAAAQWDEALLKDASGGGTMTARFMRADEFTFPVTFKLTGYGNHKPTFPGGVNPAIRRRFVFAEFMFKPKVADKSLADVFRREMPGILRWALNGLVSPTRGVRAVGLMVPQSMQDAADAYFAEADPLERWMAERVTLDASKRTPTGELFEDWNKWRIANNEHGYEAVNVFSAALKDAKGLVPYKTMTTRGFRGIALKGSGAHGAADAFDDELKP